MTPFCLSELSYKGAKMPFRKKTVTFLSAGNQMLMLPKTEQWIEKNGYVVDDDVETKHCNGNDHKVEKKYGDSSKQTTKNIA